MGGSLVLLASAVVFAAAGLGSFSSDGRIYHDFETLEENRWLNDI